VKKKLDRHDDHDRKVREGGREITIGAIDSLAQIRAEVITLITAQRKSP
jgi:hypothetical protein